MIKFLLTLLVFISHSFASPMDEAIRILDSLSSETQTSQRMELASQGFLELPYGFGGPLGEGSEGRYDQDPLFRFDTFDCTTFVETVLSLALSKDGPQFEMTMNHIRYENGEIDFLKRNHFPSLQWIPYNIQNGILTEINEEIAPPSERLEARAIINLPGWLKKLKITDLQVPNASESEKLALVQELNNLANEHTPQLATLDYIPLSYFLRNPDYLKSIPHGAIVNFVRPNWDLTEGLGTHMNVSHQGLLFWHENVLYLRHAGVGEKKVSDIPFLDYLKRFENHPTLKGVHFMKLTTDQL
jgi:hypothetical protein